MTHRRARRCRAVDCRSRAILIALVDDVEPLAGEDRARFGVGLCRSHGHMWILTRFARFKLKPHTAPEGESDAADELEAALEERGMLDG